MTGCRRPSPATTSRSAKVHELHVKYQGRVSGNPGWLAGGAIGQPVGDDERAARALPHRQERLVPALDDLARPDLELEGGPAMGEGAVERRPVEKLSGILRLDGVAYPGRSGACPRAWFTYIRPDWVVKAVG